MRSERGERRGVSSRPRSGGLAQLARAPALQAGGHRFDSDILHIKHLKIKWVCNKKEDRS